MATKAELLEKAQSLGLQVDDKMTVKELTAAIAGAEGGEGGEGGSDQSNQGFKYPVYDKWKVDVESIAGAEGSEELQEEIEKDSELQEEKAPELKKDNAHFVEWNCSIKNGKETKLAITRKCVKITEEEAEVLNRGTLKGGNTYGLMYFRPE